MGTPIDRRFERLKEAGEKTIAMLNSAILKGELGGDNYYVKSDTVKMKTYQMDFLIFDIPIRLKYSLRSNCEDTKLGTLSVFWVETKEEEEILHPVDMWGKFPNAPRDDNKNILSNEFHIFDGKYMLTGRSEDTIQGIDTPDGSGDFVFFFWRNLPSIIADMDIEIPLKD